MASRYNSGRSNMVAAMLDTIVKKEGSYRGGIETNHRLSVPAAARLSKESGDLEQALMMIAKENNSIISEEEVQSFLEEQRGRLKKLAEKNVENERTVDSFVAACKQLREQELSQPSQNEGSQEEFKDYDPIIKDLMQKDRADRQSTQLNMEHEAYYREILTRLGEQTAATGDEDIEVVTSGGSSQVNSLKCPVTGELVEDAVKNKVCGHVYSRRGIESHMQKKGHRCPCPVPGCNNNQVLKEQLEKDVVAEQMVRREKRRQDKAAQLQASQASIIDSDDEE